MMKNIYLLGFMGSGKTTVGRRLAEELGYSWQDLDRTIALRNEKSIREIFRIYGEAFFRKEEANVLRNTALEEQQVISCGGGTPCFHNNMRWINEHGISVFLDVDFKVLYQRLKKGQEHRPLLRDKTPEELEAFIKNKLVERRTDYEQAMIIIHQEEEDVDVASQIIRQIKKQSFG